MAHLKARGAHLSNASHGFSALLKSAENAVRQPLPTRTSLPAIPALSTSSSDGELLSTPSHTLLPKEYADDGLLTRGRDPGTLPWEAETLPPLDAMVEKVTVEGSAPLQTSLRHLCMEYRDIFSMTVREQPAAVNPMEITVNYASWASPLTAFITHGGLYEWIRVPMGIKGAPSYFQNRMASKVLAGLIYNLCEVYLDDIIVHGRTETEFLHNLRTVFTRLRHFGITLRPD
ncbi:MAG: RNA-directed DNA polymerase [Micrococcales bacterium]|nr:RNA-directed DNA polymerase [Micrococcales bacterium]